MKKKLKVVFLTLLLVLTGIGVKVYIKMLDFTCVGCLYTTSFEEAGKEDLLLATYRSNMPGYQQTVFLARGAQHRRWYLEYIDEYFVDITDWGDITRLVCKDTTYVSRNGREVSHGYGSYSTLPYLDAYNSAGVRVTRFEIDSIYEKGNNSRSYFKEWKMVLEHF